MFLWLGDAGRLGIAAKRAIRNEDLVTSAAAVLELEFLHEIRRLDPTAQKVISDLSDQVGLRVCDLPFRTVVQEALAEKWSRDPFDRLIVANAKVNGAALLTKDERIRRHYPHAIW
jgi:PIN domain nuclease of toxin-antitoxin system